MNPVYLLGSFCYIMHELHIRMVTYYCLLFQLHEISTAQQMAKLSWLLGETLKRMPQLEKRKESKMETVMSGGTSRGETSRGETSRTEAFEVELC